MERQEMEAFLALAEELHFGHTARRLGLSVGRVSQLIRTLERRVGALLFERTSRRVVMTPIGARLREDLLPAHRQITAALEHAVAAGRGISGRLRVGFSSQMVARLLMRAIEAFKAVHPACEVTIQEVLLSDPYGPLRRAEVHLQVTELPLNEPDLVAGPTLLSYPRSLLVPVGHALARSESVSLEDLADATLLTVGGSAPPHWCDHHFPRHTPSGRPIPHGHAAVSWHEIPVLVADGQGVTLASAGAEHLHAAPGVVWVPVRDATPVLYAPIWPKQGATAKVRAFVEALRTAAGQGPDAS